MGHLGHLAFSVLIALSCRRRRTSCRQSGEQTREGLLISSRPPPASTLSLLLFRRPRASDRHHVTTRFHPLARIVHEVAAPLVRGHGTVRVSRDSAGY